MAVRVRIDELVLHGFDPLQRDAIAEAIREELWSAAAELPLSREEIVAAITAAVERGVSR